MDFTEKYKGYCHKIDSALGGAVSGHVCPSLKSSAEYSLLGGGKRLRPVLYLSVLDSYGGTPTENDMAVACAIECIHTYSLIHDDLPSMDNDDYRRGKLTNHKKFGEAMAILAGDGLLNLAYELLAGAVSRESGYAPVMRVIAENAGMLGMVGGQAMELSDSEDVEQIAYLKTGKLIEAAVVAACRAAGRAEDENGWREFALSFGKAFQYRDDLLDMSEERARGEREALLRESHEGALRALGGIPCDASFLRALTDKMLLRTTDGI